MGIEFDVNAILNSAIMAKLKDSDDKTSYEVMKVFERHGINVAEAMQILVEIGLAVSGNNERN